MVLCMRARRGRDPSGVMCRRATRSSVAGDSAALGGPSPSWAHICIAFTKKAAAGYEHSTGAWPRTRAPAPPAGPGAPSPGTPPGTPATAWAAPGAIGWFGSCDGWSGGFIGGWTTHQQALCDNGGPHAYPLRDWARGRRRSASGGRGGGGCGRGPPAAPASRGVRSPPTGDPVPSGVYTLYSANDTYLGLKTGGRGAGATHRAEVPCGGSPLPCALPGSVLWDRG